MKKQNIEPLRLPFEMTVRTALRTSEDELCRKSAQLLVKEYMQGRPLEKVLAVYAQICHTLERLRTRIFDPRPDESIVNHIIRLVCAYYVNTLYFEVDTAAQQDFIDKIVTSIKEHGGEGSWMHPRFMMFSSAMQDRMGTMAFVQNSFKQNLVHSAFIKLFEHHPGIGQKIIHELMTLRKYGLKPCFFQEKAGRDANLVWVVADPRSRQQEVPDPFYQKNLLTYVDQAPLAALKASIGKIAAGEKVENSHAGLAPKYPSQMTWTIDQDGTIDHSMGLGVSPVREVFQRAGREIDYEITVLKNALWLSDLMMPIELLNKIPKFGNPLRGLMNMLRPGSSDRSFNPIRDLILPRVRYLENPNLTIEALEREIQQAEERTRRDVGRHEVVGFARKLPKGKKASPEAIARAKEDGITLAPNETYVQTHWRGTGEQVVFMHRARTLMDVL